MLIDALLILGGSGLLVLTAWRRRGRSGGRAWANELYNRQGYLFWLPGFGLMLVAAGVIGFAEALDVQPMGYAAGLLFLLGGLVSLWGGLFLPVPSWYLPAWLRPIVARERREARERRADRRRRRRGQKAAGTR